MKLLQKRYKRFLNVYKTKRGTYLVQQNPNTGSRWAKYYPRLYWELRKYPIPGKLDYTGKKVWFNN